MQPTRNTRRLPEALLGRLDFQALERAANDRDASSYRRSAAMAASFILVAGRHQFLGCVRFLLELLYLVIEERSGEDNGTP